MDQFERKLSDPIWYIFAFDYEMSVLTSTGPEHGCGLRSQRFLMDGLSLRLISEG